MDWYAIVDTHGTPINLHCEPSVAVEVRKQKEKKGLYKTVFGPSVLDRPLGFLIFYGCLCQGPIYLAGPVINITTTSRN
jgi:hypothetical protein